MGLIYREKFLDGIIFLVIGNFITSCFSKNFTPFELLRRPIRFKLRREQNFLVAEIPKGIPWTDSILKIDKVIATRVRDIPVQKGLKEVDKKNDLFLIDISFFLRNIKEASPDVLLQTGELTYSPWYRFVNEPYIFNLDKTSTNYVAQAIAYILKSQELEVSIDNNPSNNCSTVVVSDPDSVVDKIEIEGESEISEIRIISNEGISFLSLKNKNLSLHQDHSKTCFDALDRADPNIFENVRLVKNKKNIELNYE
tara:strand:+ start:937 stop:1698 length:762 start_codon:yes stop_codon:yes gene_type:complete